MRTLTTRELNRALLARQLMLERAPVSPARAVEQVAGIQAQSEPAAAMGIAARIEGFRPEQLARARLVRATLMRATVHLVSERDYLLFLPALLPSLQRKWRQYRAGRPDSEGLDELAKPVLAAAAEPRSAAELRALLEDDEQGSLWSRIRYHFPFVRVDGKYVAASAWLSRPFAEPTVGLEHLVRRYLRAFGPATLADIALWSGLQVAEVRPVVERLSLRRFLDESGRTLLDVRGAALPPADTPVPPRVLPRFDNLILSHADRTRIVADEHRPLIIHSGEVGAVFLIDGYVAGRWKHVRKKLELDPFVKLSRKDVRALEDEARRLVGSA